MFRAISRLLRNNHIIRILTICQVIIVISLIPIFAQPTTQDISGMTQTVYNFTLWSDFTTNVDYYYGQQTASYEDTVLTTMASYLQKLDYYFDTQTHTLYMYVPSTNTVQSISGRHLPEIISYINYNLSYAAQREYESELLLSRLVTQMGGTNGSYVQDIALDVDAYLPALTELTKLESIDWTNSSVTYQGCFDSPQGTQLSTWTAYPDRTDFYFLFSGFTTNDDDNVFFIELPFQSWSGNNDINYINVTSASGNPINENYYDIGFTNSNGGLYLYFHNGIQYNSFYIHINVDPTFYLRNNVATIKYINSQSADFYKVYDNILLQGILNKDFTADISGDVTVDTSDLENKIDDVINAIDDVSLVNNNVKLNLNINSNTSSDGTSIIGRLQNFFNTGTSVSDFFDNVDDAESGWFTQTNSDLINTLSGGYVNLYE